jgi:hypothetical protein
MSPVFKKLNFKDQVAVHLVNAPESFLDEAKQMEGLTKTVKSLPKSGKVHFVVGFCTQQQQVDALAEKVSGLLEGDGIFWIAYPKGTSKKYKCDFNRDTGWQKLGELGFEPVRQVAIDEDWSALRFRRVLYIKKMTRSFAMTEEGKIKTGK